MEASALQQPLAPRVARISIGPRLLRLRSNEQLVSLFRAGDDDAFRVIHDRYRGALLTYVRHVLGASNSDAEDVLQDVFVRAYRGLRAHDRSLNLSPWLYRVARNACIDELRRRLPIPQAEMPHVERELDDDPVLAESIRRERVRRLMSDLQRLPEQQRSALLLCELSGMSYVDVAETLGTSVSAVKSLLVRARLGLAQSLEARETACSEICDELASAHAHGGRPTALARRHLNQCQGCRQYERAMRDRQRQLAALAPTVAPLAALAKLFGGGAGSGTTAGVAAAGAGSTGAASGGVAVSAGLLGANAAHVLTVLAATTIVAAGAVGIKEATATHTAGPSPAHIYPPAESSALAAPVGPATVAGSLRGAAAARTPIHHVASAGSKTTLGGGTAPSSGAAPSTPVSTPAPLPTSHSTTSKSSSTCPIGETSCGSGSQVTATTTPSSTSTTSTSRSQSPLGSGGSSTSLGSKVPQLSTTPIGGSGNSASGNSGSGGSGSGAAPPTSGSAQSSPPLGSSGSPPLGS